MRVCIDAFAVTSLYGTGLYSYNLELLNSLFKIYPQPKYNVIWNSNSVLKKWTKYKNIEYLNLEIDRYRNEYNDLEEYIEKNKIHIYHSPNNGLSIPNNKKCKQIITVHDLIPISHKQYSDEKYFNKFNNVFPSAIEKSDKIIAVSNFIKNEIVDNFKIDKNKVEVIYPGCSSIFKNIEGEKTKSILYSKYKIKGDYILYVGSIHKRKNIHVFLEIFKEVIKINKDLKFVIVGQIKGKREEYYCYLKMIINRLGLQDNIIFTGVAEYEDMPYFYNGSICTVNLSEYEGFPLTAIESMACNKATICAKESSFKEVLGNEAILVNPNEKAIIRDILLECIYNKNYRLNIEDKLKNNKIKYTWDSSIKKLVNVYESIA